MKRTLYFGNEAYLSTQKRQLVITYPENDIKKSVPIEDIGIVLLDHYQLTITSTTLIQDIAVLKYNLKANHNRGAYRIDSKCAVLKYNLKANHNSPKLY